MKRWAFGVYVVYFTIVGFCRADHPSQKEEIPPAAVGRHDQQGDSLPEGAIARLGTVRWRHGNAIVSLSFSPDGKTLASASHDDTVRLWEVASGKEIRRFIGQEHSWMSSVAISPDGKTLASASHHNVIRLFEAATGKPIRILKGHTHIVWCLAFSPDGESIASGGGDSTMRLWEVRSGKEVTSVQRGRPVNSVAFTRDGKGILTADYNSGVRLWDIASRKDVSRFRVSDRHENADQDTHRVAVSLDGKWVAAGGNLQNPHVCVWELATGKQVHLFRGEMGEVSGLAFSPDGKQLASGHSSGSNRPRRAIILWDLQAGKELKRLGEPGLIASSLTISPNGRYLAAGMNETIRVWDLVEDKELGRYPPAHKASIVSIAAAPDGKTVSTCSNDGTVRLWDARTGAERRLVARFDEYPRASAFTADGKRLVVVAYETSVWDLETGKELSRFDSSHPSWFGALSANGELLAMKSGSGVKLWQTATGKELGEIGDWEKHERDVVLSANGHYLAVDVDSPRDLFQIWETASGKKLHERQLSEGGKRKDTCLTGFTEDGGKLVMRDGGDLWLFDVRSGEVGRRFPCFDVASSAVSSHGKGIAVGELSGSIRLLDTATGDVAAEWQGRNRPGPQTTFDYGSRTTLARKNPSGERSRLKGHQGYVTCLAFSHDNKTLFSGSSDTTVLVWDLSGMKISEPDPKEPGGQGIDYVGWIIAAGLGLLALAVLWLIVSFFRRHWLQSA